MKGDLPRPGIGVLSRGLLTSRSPQALGQASVPHSDFFSHLAPGPPQNFNQAFCPDDSQLPSSTAPLSLRVFFFWPLQTVPRIVLTPRPPEESLPLSSRLFLGRSQNSFLPVLAPQPFPPGSLHQECSAPDPHVAPPFLHSGLSPNATSLERPPLPPSPTPMSPRFIIFKSTCSFILLTVCFFHYRESLES